MKWPWRRLFLQYYAWRLTWLGAVGQQARAAQTARYDSFNGVVQGPPVGVTEIDISNPHWAPAMCWVYQDACVHSLSFDVAGAEFLAFTPQIWLAGDSGDSVNLVWEVWDSAAGWRSAGRTGRSNAL